jgi:hypothetical protein
VLGEESAAFIHRNKEKPWLLYTAFNAPHTPNQATPELLERVKHIADENRRTYAAMIVGMDDAVGRILQQLRDDGLEERTLIFFLSDNGGTTENNTSDNTPLRGRKGMMWEGGIRVPFLAQWKGAARRKNLRPPRQQHGHPPHRPRRRRHPQHRQPTARRRGPAALSNRKKSGDPHECFSGASPSATSGPCAAAITNSSNKAQPSHSTTSPPTSAKPATSTANSPKLRHDCKQPSTHGT